MAVLVYYRTSFPLRRNTLAEQVATLRSFFSSPFPSGRSLALSEPLPLEPRSHRESLAGPGASSLEDSGNEEISDAWSRAVLWAGDGRRRERGNHREGKEAVRCCRPRHLDARPRR